MIKTCVVCGREFEARCSNQVTHSLECRQKRYAKIAQPRSRKYTREQKDISALRRRENYRRDPARYNDRSKAWREANREKYRACRRKYYVERKIAVKESGRRYRENNREKLREYMLATAARRSETARARYADKKRRLMELAYIKQFIADNGVTL